METFLGLLIWIGIFCFIGFLLTPKPKPPKYRVRQRTTVEKVK